MERLWVLVYEYEGRLWTSVYDCRDQAEDDLREWKCKGIVIAGINLAWRNYGLVSDLPDYSEELER